MAEKSSGTNTKNENGEYIYVNSDQLINLLASSISSDVYQKIEEKQTRKRNVFIGLASLVFAIILSFAGYLISNTVDVLIDKKINLAQGEIIRESVFIVEVAALDIEARSLRDSSEFTLEDARSIIKKIEQLYKQGVVNQTNFNVINENKERLTYAVNSAILAFAEANRFDLILEVERKATLVAQESEEVPLIIGLSLGDMLIQDPRSPDSWYSGGMSHAEYQRFVVYLKKLKDKNYPEFYLLYELLMGEVKGLSESQMLPLLSDLDDLQARDIESFKRKFQEILQLDRTSGEVRQKNLALKLLENYSEKSTVLKELRDSTNS